LWISTDGYIVPFLTNLQMADEFEAFSHGNSIPAACIVHTRDALVAAGYWPEDVPACGDWILWRRMLQRTDRPLAYLREPTTLHFSARGRKSRHAGNPTFGALLQVAEAADWWPRALRMELSEIESEQAAAWARMQDAAWPEAVRQGCDDAISRLAAKVLDPP